MRYARLYILAHPSDCDPPHGLDMTSRHDYEKVEMLEAAFRKDGFDPAMPALVGYPLDGRIQLLSGTHRHLAATRANIFLPITLKLRSLVEASWGIPERWDPLIADIPVRDLEWAPVKESDWIPGLDERVSFR